MGFFLLTAVPRLVLTLPSCYGSAQASFLEEGQQLIALGLGQVVAITVADTPGTRARAAFL